MPHDIFLTKALISDRKRRAITFSAKVQTIPLERVRKSFDSERQRTVTLDRDGAEIELHVMVKLVPVR